MPKESSHCSLAGSLKKTLAFFGQHANEKCNSMQVKNFLSTLTTNKACLGMAHQKLELSVHTERNELWLGEGSL